MGVRELALIFGSKTKAQEILYLLSDAKDVVRQGFYCSAVEQIQEVRNFCKAYELFVVESPFQVVLADDSLFSNKGLMISNKTAPGQMNVGSCKQGRMMMFLYISKDEVNANLAVLYETRHDDRSLGLLLGYPACCVQYFISHFSADNPNPQIISSNPFTNISLREKDCVLISHFPCSADCQESIALGKKYLEILKTIDLDRADEIVRMLRHL